MWTTRRNPAAPIAAAQAWGITCRGRKHGPNQDRVLLGAHIIAAGQVFSDCAMPLVLAVADGISGDPGGDIAAQTALQTLSGTAPAGERQAVELLEQANEKIREEAAAWPPALRNMCTTLSAVWIFRDRIVLCARGDTPIYFVGNRRTVQVSAAHTDRAGRLTSYLGADAHVTVRSTFTEVVEASPASVRAVLIMSDGISRFVAPRAVSSAAARRGAALPQIGMQLMRAAWQAGSRDNMSFVMARIEAQ